MTDESFDYMTSCCSSAPNADTFRRGICWDGVPAFNATIVHKYINNVCKGIVVMFFYFMFNLNVNENVLGLGLNCCIYTVIYTYLYICIPVYIYIYIYFCPVAVRNIALQFHPV